jgi:hypothetical protein
MSRTPSVAAVEVRGSFFSTEEATTPCHYVRFLYGTKRFGKTAAEVKDWAEGRRLVFKRRPGSWTHNAEIDSEDEFLQSGSSWEVFDENLPANQGMLDTPGTFSK